MSKNNSIEAGVLNSGEDVVRLSEYAEILEKIRIIEEGLMHRREELVHNRTSVELREKLLNKYLESGKALADTDKERDHFLLNPKFLVHFKKNVSYLEEKIRVEEFKIMELKKKRDGRLSEFQEAAHSEITRSVNHQVKEVQPLEGKPCEEGSNFVEGESVITEEAPKPLKADPHQHSSPSGQSLFSGGAMDLDR